MWATALDHAALRAFAGSPYLSRAWHLWGLTTEGQIVRHLPPERVRMQGVDFLLTGNAEPLSRAADELVEEWRADCIRARLDGADKKLQRPAEKTVSPLLAERLDVAGVLPGDAELAEAVREEVFNGTPVDWHALAQYSNLTPMQAARAALYIDPFRWPDEKVHAQGPMSPAKLQEQARLEQRLRGLQAEWNLARLAQVLGDRTPAGMRAEVGLLSGSPSVLPEKGELKRAALIELHRREWPTIERDLRDASSNDLAKSARSSRHGYWREGDALNWARQRGKLKTQRLSSEVVGWEGTARKHRMKG